MHLKRQSRSTEKLSRWNDLGDIYLKAESYDEAIVAYSKAIELAPNFGWPYRNLLPHTFPKVSSLKRFLCSSKALICSKVTPRRPYPSASSVIPTANWVITRTPLEAYQQADVLAADLSDQPARDALDGALTAADFATVEPQVEAVPTLVASTKRAAET